MTKQNKIFIAIAVAIIVIGFILMAREGQAPTDNGGQALRPIDMTDHVRGDLNAPVQIIVYSDFECPFCLRFAETMKQIEEYFKDQVAITFRHYPLFGHFNAKNAAEAAECAGQQGKFWEMHDKLFADNSAGQMSVEQFKQDAADLGLDQSKFNQCLDSGQFAGKVAEQKAEGDKAGVTGSPTIFVNGNIYPGAYPFEDFTSPGGRENKGMKSIINELLNK